MPVVAAAYDGRLATRGLSSSSIAVGGGMSGRLITSLMGRREPAWSRGLMLFRLRLGDEEKRGRFPSLTPAMFRSVYVYKRFTLSSCHVCSLAELAGSNQQERLEEEMAFSPPTTTTEWKHQEQLNDNSNVFQSWCASISP